VSYTNAPTATPVTLNLLATNLKDQAGIIDVTNDVITGLQAFDRIEVDAELVSPVDSGGTYRKMWLEYEPSPGVWETFNDGEGAVSTTLDGYHRFVIRAQLDGAFNVRLRYQHDAGANRSIYSTSFVYISVKRPS
jgi:hypothetical protein